MKPEVTRHSYGLIVHARWCVGPGTWRRCRGQTVERERRCCYFGPKPTACAEPAVQPARGGSIALSCTLPALTMKISNRGQIFKVRKGMAAAAPESVASIGYFPVVQPPIAEMPIVGSVWRQGLSWPIMQSYLQFPDEILVSNHVRRQSSQQTTSVFSKVTAIASHSHLAI